MYIRIIYPSTLITIGGTALCLEQKKLGSETETGAGRAIWDEGNNHSQINEERHPRWRVFRLKRGIAKTGPAHFSLKSAAKLSYYACILIT
jgi:hypothetical protein